jgi:hypothetical protein
MSNTLIEEVRWNAPIELSDEPLRPTGSYGARASQQRFLKLHGYREAGGLSAWEPCLTFVTSQRISRKHTRCNYCRLGGSEVANFLDHGSTVKDKDGRICVVSAPYGWTDTDVTGLREIASSLGITVAITPVLSADASIIEFTPTGTE